MSAKVFFIFSTFYDFHKNIFEDVRRQIHELSTTVYQIRGHIKGKTLLPFPQWPASDIADEERRVRESDGKEVDILIKNNIEGIIIKWAHQVVC